MEKNNEKYRKSTEKFAKLERNVRVHDEQRLLRAMCYEIIDPVIQNIQTHTDIYVCIIELFVRIYLCVNCEEM